MTTRLTDPELAAMLRATFADHEDLADPDAAQRLAGAVPSPSPDPPLWRRRGVLVAGLAASVAVVAGVAGVQEARDARTPAGPLLAHSQRPTAAATAPASADTDAGHRSATDVAVRTALAGGPTLPGGRAATAGQTGRMSGGSTVLSEHLVRQTGYAVAPGTVDQGIAYLRDHPPAGYATGGWGAGGDRGLQFVDYEPLSLAVSDTDAYAGLRLTVTVVTQGAGVAVRTDAEALWRPARLAGTRLPADARLTGISISRIPLDSRFGTSVLRRVTVTPALQTRVAAAVAALRPSIPDLVASCPPATETVNDVFTFTSRQGTVTVTAKQVCLGAVTVARDGVAVAQVLGPAAGLDDLVKNEPGTPTR